MNEKLIRCSRCGTVLIRIVCRAFAPGSKVLMDVDAKCRQKKCVAKRRKDYLKSTDAADNEELEMYIEDAVVSMNPPVMRVVKRKRKG